MGSRVGPGLTGVVFDTNIIIDHLNGVALASEQLLAHPLRYASVVTFIEVLAGFQADAAEVHARRLLRRFRIVETAEVADHAIRIRRERRLKLPDAIILATARHLGCKLVTRNTKDFPRDDPDILVPYEL